MASSGQGGPSEVKDEPKGLKKFIRRASLVLRPKSKRQSISDASAFAPTKESAAAAQSSSTAPTSSSAVAPASTKADTTPTLSVPAQITQVIKENKPAPTAVKPRTGMTSKDTSALQEEKAKALFAKYGLTLEPGEWTTPVTGGAPRVEKQVRMRIHRTCHRCQTTFGPDRICSNCQHTRCKKCPRFPGSKTKASKGKGVAAGGVAVDDGKTKNGEALTMPHRGTGKEMTRRLPTQRVRRTCHACETLFVGKAIQCEKCKHTRCPKCPRDPPKTEKYPDGYPGDTPETYPPGERGMKPIRTKVRWNCEKCETTFKDHENTCGKCGHEKCDSCPRKPPSKTKEPVDEAAVRSVEERMKNLNVSPQASAA